MSDVHVYGPSYSTYVRTARMTLAEKGVPYDLVMVDMLGGETGKPDYLARHPFGKVPSFSHGDLHLYETSAIVRYVDRAFHGSDHLRLTPEEPALAARMDQIISIIDSYAYGSIVGQLVWQRVVVPMIGGTPDEAVAQAALPRVKLCLAELERLAGGGDQLVGSGFTLADAYLAPVMAYLLGTPEAPSLLETTPKLRAWWSAVSARPSFTATQPQFG